MSTDDLDKYPEKDAASGPYKALQVAAGALDMAVPLAGATANAIISHFIAEPLQARRDEFFRRVADRLSAVEQAGHLKLEDLRSNEEFISVVAEATVAATRTHREEKREALVNAAVNTATGMKLDDVLRNVFLRHIAEYSALHIRVLRLLSSPEDSIEMVQAAAEISMGAPRHVLNAALQGEDGAAVSRVLADLANAGLADTGSLAGMTRQSAFLTKRTTDVGDAFLRFIGRTAD
ncbi:hypothetical protein IHQ68_03430 [Chelatococcus sambhunathii]|uniref:DUF4393 domain-containing protein n=1 Tax=Chelatococcus sambhunathii TaxID=363953 RepID=A0ABU1DCA9_9HYPH|nr:hypothetical protein [Chelatococcus sambhunathii]MDR4305674.1 hypothetical protein [Chelatococcus sambhunathii]